MMQLDHSWIYLTSLLPQLEKNSKRWKLIIMGKTQLKVLQIQKDSSLCLVVGLRDRDS